MPGDFELTKAFVADAINNIDGSVLDANFALAEYSDSYNPATEIFVDAATVVGLLNSLGPSQGVTFTGTALQGALLASTINGRPNVPKVIVLVTDGRTSPMDVSALDQVLQVSLPFFTPCM